MLVKWKVNLASWDVVGRNEVDGVHWDGNVHVADVHSYLHACVLIANLRGASSQHSECGPPKKSISPKKMWGHKCIAARYG